MIYSFSDIALDTDTLRLRRAGQEVAVEPQVFDLLVLLAQNAGKVVSKDDLIETVWNGRIVSDATISARINAARTAIGDDGQAQKVIRTHQRRGFELVPPVSSENASSVPTPSDTPDRQRIRYATSQDGTRIAYATSGTGPPLLRAGHHLTHLELDWNSYLWRPMWDRLGQNQTLIRFDVRGTGLSDPLRPGSGIEDYVADICAVADAAGIETFPLLAHLQATPVAIRFIAEHPDRVSRLVVQNGYVRGRAMRPNAPQTPDSDPVVALMKNGWGDPDNGFMRAWVSMIVPNASHEEVTDMIRLLSGATRPEAVVESRQTIDRFTAEDLLGKVDVPTLVVHSRGDTIHPVEEARDLAMGIRDAELLIVESPNTLAIPSDPTWEEQLSAILGFLAEGNA